MNDTLAINGDAVVKPGRLAGFDIARTIALLLVTWQHLLSLHGFTPGKSLLGLDAGQLGVSLFCAISGWFAMSTSSRSAGRWLFRRLSRIYVPMWLTLIPLLISNELLGYKPAPASLVLSEAAGAAYFTHPGDLVGVHLWFVSLIVLCYVLASLAHRWVPLLPLIATGSLVLMCFGHPFLSYVSTFFVAAILGRAKAKSTTMAAAGAAALVVTHLPSLGRSIGSPVAAGLLTVAVAQALSTRLHWPTSWGWPSTVSEASYHYYLVHGPVFHAVASLIGLGLFGDAMLSAVLALLAAAVLFRLDSIVRAMARAMLFFLRPASVGQLR